jgi:hypothetical protein
VEDPADGVLGVTGGIVVGGFPTEGGGWLVTVAGGAVDVAGGFVADPAVGEAAVPVEGEPVDGDPLPEEPGADRREEELARTPDPQPIIPMAAPKVAHAPIPRKNVFKYIKLLSLLVLSFKGDLRKRTTNWASATSLHKTHFTNAPL